MDHLSKLELILGSLPRHRLLQMAQSPISVAGTLLLRHYVSYSICIGDWFRQRVRTNCSAGNSTNLRTLLSAIFSPGHHLRRQSEWGAAKRKLTDNCPTVQYLSSGPVGASPPSLCVIALGQAGSCDSVLTRLDRIVLMARNYRSARASNFVRPIDSLCALEWYHHTIHL